MRQEKNNYETDRITKRRYQPPTLRTLGNVREITKGLPSAPNDDFGGKRF